MVVGSWILVGWTIAASYLLKEAEEKEEEDEEEEVYYYKIQFLANLAKFSSRMLDFSQMDDSGKILAKGGGREGGRG